jgi:uncharacterized UBP type Zn finger protein
MSSHETTDIPGCTHLGEIRPVAPPDRLACEACVLIGSGWVHLRQCLTCGLVGCCDSSPNQHASRHARAEGHPIMRSLEPGEDWAWCVVDEVELEPA